MLPPRAEVIRRSSRWATNLALVALTPKCVFCAAAYVGLGTAFGLGGPELCGAPGGSPVSWVSVLAIAGIALGIVGLLAQIRCQLPRR